MELKENYEKFQKRWVLWPEIIRYFYITENIILPNNEYMLTIFSKQLFVLWIC